MITLEQEDTTCCYANSEKDWAKEPDGLAWERYRVKSDSDTFGAGPDLDGLEESSLRQKESCC